MTDTSRISDLLLERYVAGDVTPQQRARIDEAVRSTPSVATRLKDLEASRAAFLVASPPEAAAHRIVTRLAVEAKPRKLWQLWWLMPPVGVAAALLFGIVLQRNLPEQSLSAPAVASDEDYQLDAPAPASAVAPAPRPEPSAAKLQEVDGLGREIEAADARRASDLRQRVAQGRGAGGLPTDSRKAVRDEPSRAEESDRADDSMLSEKVRHVEQNELAKKKSENKADAQVSGGAFGAGPGGGAERPFAQPPVTLGRRPAPADAPEPMMEAETKAAASPKKGSAASSAPAAKPAPSTPLADDEAPSVSGAAPPPPAAEAAQAAPAAESRSELQRATGAAKDRATDKAEQTPIHVMTLARSVNGGVHALTTKAAVAGGTTLTASTSYTRGVMTVVGVRADGVAFVYGQKTLDGAPGVVTLRLRKATMRMNEAVFITVTDAPLDVRGVVDTARDAARLPLHLQVAGPQRRFVITVTQGE